VIVDSPDAAAGSQVVTESDIRTPEGRQVVLVTTAGVERRPTAGFRYSRVEGLTSRATSSQIIQVRADPTDEVILVSSAGRAWRNQVGFVPEKAPFALLGLARDDTVVGADVLTGAEGCLVLGTRSGRIKRTRLEDLALTPGHWSRVIGFADEDDSVLFAGIEGDEADAVFITAGAQVLRTTLDAINPQAGAGAKGVAGIALRSGDSLIAGAVVPRSATDRLAVFIVSARGWCKRVPLADVPPKGRATRGVRGLTITEATGEVVAAAVGAIDAGLDVVFENGRRFHVAGENVPLENRYNRGKRLVDVEGAGSVVVRAVAL
jgi:DNA gyrase/topoisomerase IV subunit A